MIGVCVDMKKFLILLILLVLLLSACSNTGNQVEGPSIDEILDQYQKPGQPGEGEMAAPDEPLPTNGPDCYQDGEHPIAVSIVEQFPEITSYNEVMVWFCNGAQFEDILNALTTEEMTSVDANEILTMIADGMSWDQIWLELGVTEE